ncbi:MAG: hypothetical protein GEV13_21480 [Rhodospirillales bacterium]|nr:hypothetical protein [Rhodospirillales bacterium]
MANCRLSSLCHLSSWAAAQEEEDVAGKVGRQQPAAQQQHQVQRAARIAVAAQHVARHHQLVAALPALQQRAGQGLERPIVGLLGAQSPDAAAVADAGDGWTSHGRLMKKAARRFSRPPFSSSRARSAV